MVSKRKHVIFHSANSARADQSTGGSLLESPMRTAMHGRSRVSFKISVELNCRQYLFAIINKISDTFPICGSSPVG